MAAYLNRWRRTLTPLPRLLLRPKLFLLLDIRRRNTLHKTFAALRQLSAGRGSARRQGLRILHLLGLREARLKAAGMARLRDAAGAARELEHRKKVCFERWNLFVILRRVRLVGIRVVG